MIIKLERPFMVISEITERVYTIDTVEVNKRGEILHYIIDRQAWNPGRFRAKTYIDEIENDDIDDDCEFIDDEKENFKSMLGEIVSEIEELIDEI